MKRVRDSIILAFVFSLAIGFLIVVGLEKAKAQATGGAFDEYSRSRQIFFQSNNPGWAVPGSVWISFTNGGGVGRVFIQTNSWNTNGIIVYTNFTGSTGTNVLNYYTNNYPLGAWSSNFVWGIAPF